MPHESIDKTQESNSDRPAARHSSVSLVSSPKSASSPHSTAGCLPTDIDIS